jgi:hypothetical protein
MLFQGRTDRRRVATGAFRTHAATHADREGSRSLGHGAAIAPLSPLSVPMSSTQPAADVRNMIALVGVALALCASGCDTPDTTVVLDNEYPASDKPALVVYQAYWQAVSFAEPVPPAASSTAQSTIPASANTAYAVLAPGWDPASSTPPSSFVVLQSVNGFSVQLDDRLTIPIDDTTFAGNCAAGRLLKQSQADFITGFVFPTVFAGKHYDAATCTTTLTGDAGAK